MKFLATVVLSLVTCVTGCSSNPGSPQQTGDGSVVDGAALGDRTMPDLSDASQVDGNAGLDAAPSPAPAECVENPKPQPGPRSVLTVTVDLTYAGKPVTYGEPIQLPTGGTLTVSNFRFFLSDIALLREGGQPLPVDVVTADGNPAPYNVHLVNAETASEMTFRIAAPAGDYTGLSLLFGLNDACNVLDPGTSLPPLNYQSQLSWPRPFGFLYLRYEGKVDGATGFDAPLSAVAMGGVPTLYSAPRVNADGPVHVTTAPGSARLGVALDEIFKAAALPADLSNKFIPPPVAGPSGAPPGGAEIEVGEHVRQNATRVQIFSVTSGT